MMIDRSSMRNQTAVRLVVEIIELDRNIIDLLSHTDTCPSTI